MHSNSLNTPILKNLNVTLNVEFLYGYSTPDIEDYSEQLSINLTTIWRFTQIIFRWIHVVNRNVNPYVSRINKTSRYIFQIQDLCCCVTYITLDSIHVRYFLSKAKILFLKQYIFYFIINIQKTLWNRMWYLEKTHTYTDIYIRCFNVNFGSANRIGE